ncbi:MAG TPA: hypothetical protein VG367_08815 [Mucilaginibacter sp.]|nr:hypothetical protein [Mucilaginibacter sp.]
MGGIKGILAASLFLIIASAFSDRMTLKGKWEYMGGVYNGKKDTPPVQYTLQRIYDNDHFEAYALEKGYKPEKYEAGNYVIKGDTCIETQTFSMQPTKLLNLPVRYLYMVRNDSLILGGKLPTGMLVVEYWKRVK